MATPQPKGTKPNQTGFPQEYNQEPSAQPTDLNPDVVTPESELPPPRPKKPEEPAKNDKR